jgi:hypothetical protein
MKTIKKRNNATTNMRLAQMRVKWLIGGRLSIQVQIFIIFENY